MPDHDAHAVLFESVRIGPVTAKNRFYQVPHCCGLGHLRPQAHAAMRGVKAEGGWAVVSTEETEIHPSSDLSPYAEQRLWDERDIPSLALMTDAVHMHGALAAIELAHNGHHAPNLFSRVAPLAPMSMSVDTVHPMQARGMTSSDIRELRRWHRQAVANAKRAGFDIIYVYAGHHMSVAHHFLSPLLNQRVDEYGGKLENRVRLVRELLEDAQDEAAGECAIAFRLAVDDCAGADGMQAHEEGRAIVELLAELPDLWDVNVAGWENDSKSARFAPDEGYQEAYTAFVKEVTKKPVVAVGRYTSPDRMVSLVKRGVLDFVGAARPSIADPYLPNKVREGRVDEIRECIGCNICVASDNLGVPIRCTQNPTMGEEWRRGWHPERTTRKQSDDRVLVVGAGPAGLECAKQLSERGYTVALAEAERELGGRALLESRLKGLATTVRVRDYREQALLRDANVSIYRQSRLDSDSIEDLGFAHIVIATGARWRCDGVGRSNRTPLRDLTAVRVLTPDDIMRERQDISGAVVVYDDDQIYLGGVLADHLSEQCADVTLVTPAAVVSPWTAHTLEQAQVQRNLLLNGVAIKTNCVLACVTPGALTTRCIYSGKEDRIACDTLVLVTERAADPLELAQTRNGADAQSTIQVIGDAFAPGLIADAVFAGHKAAREFQADPRVARTALFAREMPHVPNDSCVVTVSKSR